MQQKSSHFEMLHLYLKWFEWNRLKRQANHATGIKVTFRIWNTFKLVICGANVSIVQISFYHFI